MDPVTVSIVVSAPREQVFDYLQDIANHPEFTDHYLVDWHLTRIDSVGRGRGRALSREGARQPLQLGRRDVRRGRAPAPDRRGRAAPARTTASARSASTSSRPPRRGTTRVRFTLRDRARDAVRPADGGARRARAGCGARTRGRCAGCARSSSASEGRGPARHGRRRIDCRVACPAACASSPLVALALLAVLALGACGDSHTRVTTGTYAGESGQNAPYLDVGPLIYEVQLSRELNPANTEDAAYLQGLTPAQRKLEPGQEWFGGVHAGLQQHARRRTRPSTNLTITDTQGNIYSPIVPDADQPVRLPRRAGPGQRPAARARARSRPTGPPRARCCSTRSRSSRSTTGRSS